MARPWLAEIAYTAYCEMRACPLPAFADLPRREQLAWGEAVQAGVRAAHALPTPAPLHLPRLHLPGSGHRPPSPAQTRRRHAVYRLAVEEHQPCAVVCAQLGISPATYYRDLKAALAA